MQYADDRMMQIPADDCYPTPRTAINASVCNRARNSVDREIG